MSKIGVRIIQWLILLALFCISLYFFPLTMVSHKTCEIDVNSGRLRTQSRIFGFVVSEHIEETIITKYVPDNINSTSDWRCIMEEPLWPNYLPQVKIWIDPKYGDVRSQLELIRLIWKKSNPPFEERQRFARKVLLLWKESSDDKNGAEFIENTFVRMTHEGEGGSPVQSNNSSDGK